MLPLPWHDERAVDAARAAGAVLTHSGLAGIEGGAGGRTTLVADRATRGWTLRPSSLVTLPSGTFLAISSPNGATLCAAAAKTGATVVAGCLRNASAVAAAAVEIAGDAPIGIVPAGERWRDTPDRRLRPGIEEILGAGAIADAIIGLRAATNDGASGRAGLGTSGRADDGAGGRTGVGAGGRGGLGEVGLADGLGDRTGDEASGGAGTGGGDGTGKEATSGAGVSGGAGAGGAVSGGAGVGVSGGDDGAGGRVEAGLSDAAGLSGAAGVGTTVEGVGRRRWVASAEAELAAVTYRAVAGRVGEVVAGSVSGRELIAAGSPDDVRLASEVDISSVVPLLTDGVLAAR